MAFWQCYYHLVWATKDRTHLITSALEPMLFGYLINRAAEHEVLVHAVNGWTDHIHVVAGLPPKHAVADIVKSLKGASSHYLNHQRDLKLDADFAWQQGYGVVTFSARNLDQAVEYVRRQKEHHRRQTTHAWLERDSDLDEGPQVSPSDLNSTRSVKVATPVYSLSGHPPF